MLLITCFSLPGSLKAGAPGFYEVGNCSEVLFGCAEDTTKTQSQTRRTRSIKNI